MLHAGFIGALNGVLGDYLEKSRNPLSINMDFYFDKQPIQGDLSIPYKHFPKAKNSVCILIHGAAASELNWSKKGQPNYIESIYQNFHYLPLTLRYNSGLHISENGQILSNLLRQLVHQNTIDDIVIIGHSMGGLIFRSALYYGRKANHTWMNKVQHAFYLGSPHHGAPLEKFGALTQSILEQIKTPYTKAANKVINIRSNGVKDLRHGYLTEEEWMADQNDKLPKNNKTPFNEVSHIQQYVVAATIAAQTDSLLANWFGDAMVRKNSAFGKSNKVDLSIPIKKENMLLLGNTAHVSLMYNQQVIDWIVQKLQVALK